MKMEELRQVDVIVNEARDNTNYVREQRDVILHVINEEMKYAVYKCLSNKTLNFENELQQIIGLYYRSSAIKELLRCDIDRFVDGYLEKYAKQQLGCPETNGCGCYWGFEVYYDGIRTPESNDFKELDARLKSATLPPPFIDNV